ncbi:hypothetical protein AB0D13_14770 [Streptomyces sp. NPDC048430]|uniref:hypothetical protein n=1 Tax=unclassified Streptomyces TaxID=2593676 RepID=UPI0034454907
MTNDIKIDFDPRCDFGCTAADTSFAWDGSMTWKGAKEYDAHEVTGQAPLTDERLFPGTGPKTGRRRRARSTSQAVSSRHCATARPASSPHLVDRSSRQPVDGRKRPTVTDVTLP